MHVVIVILGVLLFPKASALKCNVATCTPEKACPETQQECPASQQCGAVSFRSYLGSIIVVDIQVKSCMASSAGCGRSGSVNFGIASTLISGKCCSTDLCNVQYPTLPAKSSPNGKKCYTCKGEDCSNNLSCSGDEDRCISARVASGGTEIKMKGCVAKSLCVSLDGATFPGMSDLSCCEGNLCNGATSTAVGLLLLVAAVVSVALFN